MRVVRGGLVATVIAGCFLALVSCGADAADGPREIVVRYRVDFLGVVPMGARIRFATPGGEQVVNVHQLPSESDSYAFSDGGRVWLTAKIPELDPTGNLQCEILTDEPGTTFASVPTRTCRARGILPFGALGGGNV